MLVHAMTVWERPEMMELLEALGAPWYVISRAAVIVTRKTLEDLGDGVPQEIIVPVALDMVEMLVAVATRRTLFPCDGAMMAAAKQGVLLKLTH